MFLVLSACGSGKFQRVPEEEYRQIEQQLNRGEFDEAAVAARKLWLRAPDSEWGWRFKLQYALSLIYTDRVEPADSLLRAKLPAKFLSLRPRYQLVVAYLRCREHDPATPSLVRAAIATAQSQRDAATEADGLLLLLRCDQTADVQAIAGQALSVAQHNHLTFEETASLSELGMNLLERNQYADAIEYFRQAASKAQKIRAHYFEVSSLINLGECYFSLGDLDRALRNLKQALPLLRPSDPSVLRIGVNNELGSISSLRQQNAEAIQYFRAAFAIAARDTRLSSYVPTAENLSNALIESHAPDEAEKYYRLAAQSLKENRDSTRWLIAQNELNWAAIQAERSHLVAAEASYRKVLDILKGEHSDSTKWSAYAQLAVLEERLGKMPEAGKNFELALAAIEDNRSQQKAADYQITFLSALIRFYQQYVDFLIRQNQPWRALAVADSSRASVLTQGQASSRELPDFISRIERQAREANSTLLFYWLAPQSSYLWAIAPTGDSFQKLAAEADIARDVKSYSAFIQGERQDTLSAANPVGLRLYQTLIGSLGFHLPAGAKVVVVPDGALHGLNFETLLVKGVKPHYWLEDVSVTVAPSFAILLGGKKPEPASGKALIMGDPVYAGTDYPALPESGREVTSVRARFPEDSTVLTQGRAVRSAYASADPGVFSLIHFSAHVDADAQSPLDSAIILSPGEGGSRLYARDVMAIPLRAGLVTISGCRSVGAKALSGEGMVGFAWAALQAGARNAVTSLWAVDDRSTADLMDRFYGGITAGKPYAAALREAKLQMLQTSFKRPYYWAPFQLYSRNIGSK